MKVSVNFEGDAFDGPEGTVVEAADYEEALEVAMDELSRPLAQVDESPVIIRIWPG